MTTAQLQLVYEQIHTKYYDKVHLLTKPLRDFFQIPYFSYQKIYLDGRYTLMANHPDFLEYYLSKCFYAYDPFLISPHFYNEGKTTYVISDEFCHFDEQTKETLSEIESKYGFYENILIIIKNFDCYEVFVFSLSSKGRKGIQAFFNYYDLFDKFIHYFQTNMCNELGEIYEIGINIADIRNMNFNPIQKDESQNMDKNDLRESFIKQVSPEEYELMKRMKKLTNREAECLYWMSKGKTAHETAMILDISKRTVEVFREKCKFKLGDHYNFHNLIYNIGKFKLLD